MNRFDQESPSAPLNLRASTTLAPDQRLERQRSALLSGLLLPGQAPPVSPGLAEVIEHRERRQATQTMGLAQLVAQELAREQAPSIKASSPPTMIRIQPPAPPTAAPAVPPPTLGQLSYKSWAPRSCSSFWGWRSRS